MRIFLASALLFTVIAARPALAADCGNVTAKGVCQDAKTLVFCEEGELEVMRCQGGEVCAYDEERFNGAAGCIATRYAGCGAVPEQGLCAGSTLLYCANGTIEELECPTGTTCEAVTIDRVTDFDCVVRSAAPNDQGQAETPVSPGEDVDGVDNPTPVDTPEGAPLPSVDKGGAGPAEVSAGGGCSGGLASSAFALLGLAFMRRRN